jgi:Cdc6-like AAA superfamily ATPase
MNNEQDEQPKQSILDFITTSKPEAPRITIYGVPGIGKTTLASTFPDPLFILTEKNGLMNCKHLPIVLSYGDLWGILNDLLSVDTLPFKTLVLDTVSKLDELVIDRTLEKSPLVKGKDGKMRKPGTIAEAWGGYGAGFEKAASLHRALKMKFDMFQDKGITVVYIAHSEIRKYKSPESEDYDIISIKMNADKSRTVYIDDVDAVLYCKEKASVIETDSKRNIVKSSGERIISGSCNSVYVSKNRFAFPKELPMNFEALSKFIPFYSENV